MIENAKLAALYEAIWVLRPAVHILNDAIEGENCRRDRQHCLVNLHLLMPNYVAASYVAGPDALFRPIPSLTAQLSGSSLKLQWPLSAPGFVLEQTAAINGSPSWTPCTGPTLGAIITAAGVSHSAAHGAFLLAVYCAGLAIPFLITGLAFGTATSAFAVIKRHYPLVIGVGGAVLIGMGMLIWTGEFTQLNVTVSHWLRSLGLPDLNSNT